MKILPQIHKVPVLSNLDPSKSLKFQIETGSKVKEHFVYYCKKNDKLGLVWTKHKKDFAKNSQGCSLDPSKFLKFQIETESEIEELLKNKKWKFDSKQSIGYKNNGSDTRKKILPQIHKVAVLPNLDPYKFLNF